MAKGRWRRRLRRRFPGGFRTRHWQWIVAAAILAAIIVFAYYHWWPFNAHPRRFEETKKPSVWQLLLGDRFTLGLIRGALAAVALFVIVSVPALVIAKRYLKGFGAGGVSADEAADASDTIEDLQRQVATLTDELNEATSQVETLTGQRNEATELAVQLYRDYVERDDRSKDEER